MALHDPHTKTSEEVELTQIKLNTNKPPPPLEKRVEKGVEAEVTEKPKFNLWKTVKKSAGEIWNTVKNHKGKIAVAALITVITGGVAAGVMVGIAGGLVAAKVTKDIAVNYGEANPESRVGRLVGAVKAVGTITKGIVAKINNVLEPVKKVAKSISHSLGNIWKTIKNNKWKAAALVGGVIVATIATGGVAGVVAGVAALAGVATKVGYDVYKDQKAGWPDHQAAPKNIQTPPANLTPSQALSKQHQQEISSLKAQLTQQKAAQKMQEQIAKMAALRGTTQVSEHSSVTSSSTPANQRPRSHSVGGKF